MRRALGSVAFVASLFAVLNCEAIVSGDVPQFNCSGTSINACPPGKYCKGSGCTTCEKVDVCDHYDNDCNGIVDDGPLSDRDGDTYTECGEIDADGKTINVDCNDNDPNVHPNDPTRHPKTASAVEVCNGVDDDCDNIVDNPDKVCPATYVCKPALQSKNPADNCVAPTSDCNTTPTLCKAPQICDQATGKCISATTSPIGATCASDRECSGPGVFCGSSAYLGVASSVCTKTCCSSADCPTDFVCYAPGTDGHYCINRTLLGIGALGSLPAGGAASDPALCRSGQAAGGQCVDVCCTNANCSAGATCSLGSLMGKTTLVCAPPPGSKGPTKSCNASSDCHEGFCAQYQVSFFTVGLCEPGCCSSTACGSDIYGDEQCSTWQAQSGGEFTACVATGNKRGSGITGADCAQDSDCQSLSCWPSSSTHAHKYCTDNCCGDNDCAATPGMHCRPVSQSGAYVLRCVYP